MEKALTFDEFIGLGLTTLNKVGWKSSENSFLRPVMFWFSMSVALTCTIIISLFPNQTPGDGLTFLSVSSEFASVAVYGSILGKTFSLLFWNYDNIRTCYVKLEKLFPKTLEEQKKFNISTVHKLLRHKNKVILGFYSWNTAMSTITPYIMIIAQNLMTTGAYELIIPIQFRFNLNFNFRVAAEVCAVLLIWCSLTSCAATVTADVLYVSVFSTLCMQFEILNQKFLEINFKENGSKKKLHELIKLHNELIEISDLAEEIFSTTVLINFLNGTIILCFLGFELFGVESSQERGGFLMFLISNLGIQFNMCWYGQRLIDCSTSIGDKIYHNNWYDGDKDVFKTVSFIILRSQNAKRLTAKKFANVSLESYSIILSTAYSYFSLLMHFNKTK